MTNSTTLPKIQALQTEMRTRFQERDAEVEGVLLAALAGEHCLLLGPAGTGKSALARGLAEALDGATYFEWLLTRFSTPEELFGPVSMSGLKADRFTRVTRGKLPEAHICFLDEIFKANSAVLNATLAALNERVFHDDGGAQAIPLVTCVAASNELPEGPELAALWDRFVVRFWTRYVDRPESFAAILRAGTGSGSVKLTLADWDAAKAEVNSVALPDSTIQALFNLRHELRQAGVEASDRRWRKAAQLVKASAWLDGASEATEEHFGILSACLWNEVDQAEKVAAAVSRFASAELLTATQVFDACIGLVRSLPPQGDDDYTARATPVVRELKKGVERLDQLAASTKSPNAKKKMAKMRADVSAAGKEIVEATKKAMGF